MVCTWLGELYYCSCLPVQPGPALVLLSYVLQTFFHYSVGKLENALLALYRNGPKKEPLMGLNKGVRKRC